MTPRLLQIVGLAMFPFFAGVPARAASTPEVLARAADILSLTAEQAKQRASISITGIVALVNTESDMEVVAETADGLQAVALFEKHQPDLVLMDSRMTFKTGIEAIIEIRKKVPGARVLVLTAFDGDADIRRAFEAGAQGYVLKSSTGEKLIPALRAVAAGERWIPQEVAHRLSSRNSYETLTARELEVLHEIAKGLANKQIAAALDITEYTVKDHLKNILAKLRVADRTEAVSVSIQRGIIHL